MPTGFGLVSPDHALVDGTWARGCAALGDSGPPGAAAFGLDVCGVDAGNAAAPDGAIWIVIARAWECHGGLSVQVCASAEPAPNVPATAAAQLVTATAQRPNPVRARMSSPNARPRQLAAYPPTCGADCSGMVNQT